MAGVEVESELELQSTISDRSRSRSRLKFVESAALPEAMAAEVYHLGKILINVVNTLILCSCVSSCHNG